MERSQTVSIAGRPSWSWAVACVAKEPSRDIIGGLIEPDRPHPTPICRCFRCPGDGSAAAAPATSFSCATPAGQSVD